MKRTILFSFLILGLLLTTKAQVNLGMSKQIIYFPDTVNYGDSIDYTAFVKNYGPDSFTGNIDVFTAVDTGGGFETIDADTSLYFITNFSAGDSLPVNLKGTYNAPSYNYERNIVVIWPSAINAFTQDSVQDTVYVRNITAIKEPVYVSNYLKIFPNPFNNKLHLEKKTPEVFIEEIKILNIKGQIIKTLNYSEVISFTDLAPGIYFLEIKTTEGISKIKVIKTD